MGTTTKETYRVKTVQRTLYVENVTSIEVDSETVVFFRADIPAVRFPLANVISYEAISRLEGQ